MPPAPSSSPSTPNERLATALAAELAAAEGALEPVDFEELAAAAEGTLDAGAQALWRERLERDPALAARAEALAAFRREAYPEPAMRPVPHRAARVAWRWAAGIAAALLVGLFVVGRGPERVPASAPPTAAVAAPALPAAPASDQAIFADGFESGDASRWVTSPPAG